MVAVQQEHLQQYKDEGLAADSITNRRSSISQSQGCSKGRMARPGQGSHSRKRSRSNLPRSPVTTGRSCALWHHQLDLVQHGPLRRGREAALFKCPGRQTLPPPPPRRPPAAGDRVPPLSPRPELELELELLTDGRSSSHRVTRNTRALTATAQETMRATSDTTARQALCGTSRV